jgi:molecular chaperone GrpE
MSKKQQKQPAGTDQPGIDVDSPERQENQGALPGTDAPDTLGEKSEWQLRAEEYLNDLKRVQADFENYKKRVQNDERELYGHLSAQIVSDLVPILDNFHAAITHVPKESAESPWVTGITYIEKQFEDVLRNYGVEPLEVKPGDHFDPTIHEALEHQGDKEKEGTLVIEKVIQKGYTLKEKIIRPAKVTVTS